MKKRKEGSGNKVSFNLPPTSFVIFNPTRKAKWLTFRAETIDSRQPITTTNPSIYHQVRHAYYYKASTRQAAADNFFRSPFRATTLLKKKRKKEKREKVCCIAWVLFFSYFREHFLFYTGVNFVSPPFLGKFSTDTHTHIPENKKIFLLHYYWVVFCCLFCLASWVLVRYLLLPSWGN